MREFNKLYFLEFSQALLGYKILFTSILDEANLEHYGFIGNLEKNILKN